jgi:hypothetical protein
MLFSDVLSKVPHNVGGLLLRWHSMNFSPERQPNNEPKAEDNYKSRTMNFQPGTTDE